MAMENYLWAIPSEMCISNLNPIVFREEIKSLVSHPCCTFFHQNLSIMQHQNFLLELSTSLLCLLFLPHTFKLHTQELLKNRFEVIWGSLCMAKNWLCLGFQHDYAILDNHFGIFRPSWDHRDGIYGMYFRLIPLYKLESWSVQHLTLSCMVSLPLNLDLMDGLSSG